jgi:hypothetical protein
MQPQQSKAGLVQLGVPILDFNAAVETLATLRDQDKCQVFLGRGSSIRFIVDFDEFRVALGNQLSTPPTDAKLAKQVLEEIRLLLHVFLFTRSPVAACKILERNVFEDQFKKTKQDKESLSQLRSILSGKLERATSRLTSPSMLERADRLSATPGSTLEDVDLEIITHRANQFAETQTTVPFLRLRFRYTDGREPNFLYFPPWVPGNPSSPRTFDIDCDQTDLDLLVRRLKTARDMLGAAVESKLKAPTREGRSK